MISGFLYKPPARFSGKRPVLVDIHGGPEGQSLPIFLGRTNYLLNELGIALIYPNVRGSTGYGKALHCSTTDSSAKTPTRISTRSSIGSPHNRNWIAAALP